MVSLLVNEEDAREFHRTFLRSSKKPRLLKLIARNKYADGQLCRSVFMLENKVLSLDDSKHENDAENRFIRELRKLDILASAGIYEDKKTGIAIPVEWMVVYVTAYPLDEEDACDAFISHVMERRKEHRRASVKQQQQRVDEPGTPIVPAVSRVTERLQSCLHQSPCRQNRFLKLDIDTKDSSLLDQLYIAMKTCEIVIAVETRGGFHVIIRRGPMCHGIFKFARSVNSELEKADHWITIEDNSGPLIAIPGTSQGGFTVLNATERFTTALDSAAEDA